MLCVSGWSGGVLVIMLVEMKYSLRAEVAGQEDLPSSEKDFERGGRSWRLLVKEVGDFP